MLLKCRIVTETFIKTKLIYEIANWSRFSVRFDYFVHVFIYTIHKEPNCLGYTGEVFSVNQDHSLLVYYYSLKQHTACIVYLGICVQVDLRRVWHANRGRLLLRTPGPVPFGICICSIC